MYREFAQLLFEAFTDEKPKIGLVGFEDDDGEYAITVSDEPTKIYVRIVDGEVQTPTEAIPFGVPRLPDYPVLIYYNKKEAYAVPDPNRPDYRGDNEGISTVEPHSHEPGFGLFDVVSTRRMREGQVTVTLPYSMQVECSGLKYWDNDGNEKWFAGGVTDLTSYVPGTSNQHRMVKIYLDRITGSLGVGQGVAKSVTVPMTEQDLLDIELDAHQKALAGVVLTNGMTAIDDERLIWDWRFWIADFVSPSGTSSSGVTVFDYIDLIIQTVAPGTPATGRERLYFKQDGVNASGVYWRENNGTEHKLAELGEVTAAIANIDLADLTDVSTAAQTANFILAAGDGTSGGDYRGRLLVANDIPSLAASKITSGTLVHERGGLEADVSAYNGLIRILAGATSELKCNFNSGGDPSINDDSGDGYAVGSIWINTVNDRVWMCTDSALGAATWVDLTDNGSSGASSFVGVSAYELAYQLTTAALADSIEFNNEEHDTDGYHDLTGNYNRITIPTGKTGYHRITFNYAIVDTDGTGQTGEIYFSFRFNPGDAERRYFSVNFDTSVVGNISGTYSFDTYVSSGDWFEVQATKYTGNNAAIYGDFYLQAQFLGA